MKQFRSSIAFCRIVLWYVMLKPIQTTSKHTVSHLCRLASLPNRTAGSALNSGLRRMRKHGQLCWGGPIWYSFLQTNQIREKYCHVQLHTACSIVQFCKLQSPETEHVLISVDSEYFCCSCPCAGVLGFCTILHKCYH